MTVKGEFVFLDVTDRGPTSYEQWRAVLTTEWAHLLMPTQNAGLSEAQTARYSHRLDELNEILFGKP